MTVRHDAEQRVAERHAGDSHEGGFTRSVTMVE
jgi:hypothetical protein